MDETTQAPNDQQISQDHPVQNHVTLKPSESFVKEMSTDKYTKPVPDHRLEPLSSTATNAKTNVYPEATVGQIAPMPPNNDFPEYKVPDNRRSHKLPTIRLLVISVIVLCILGLIVAIFVFI